MAELEELNDETRQLCDVRPTGGVLKVTECVHDRADNTLNVQIGHLIGKRKVPSGGKSLFRPNR